jgi:hypothetical protein
MASLANRRSMPYRLQLALPAGAAGLPRPDRGRAASGAGKALGINRSRMRRLLVPRDLCCRRRTPNITM